MATIIPLNNTEFATSGERRFYQFLRDALKPDSQCLAWYSPTIEGLEPDFILYTPETGLIIFEIKDWLLEQIQEADQRVFTLILSGGCEEKRTHPLQQAREYLFALMNRIKNVCPKLLASEPHFKGKIKIPIECAVVFSNITREAFCAAKLQSVLPEDKALFADDIALALSVAKDSQSSHILRGQLAQMMPPRFPFRLTTDELSNLRDALWPHVRIVLPQRSGKLVQPYQSQTETVMRLDAQQESLARRMDALKAIIRGPAGTGKTLVLVHKAIQELHRLRKRGSTSPVLLVCFNLTLVHYLKRLVVAHGVPLGGKGIHVFHFYDFCRSLLQEQLAYENEDRSYYNLIVQMAAEAAPESMRYGAVLVDEGQDFSDDMLSVLSASCADDALFWIACDTAQGLYNAKQKWHENNIFRMFTLTNPYRATRKLTAFCESMPQRHPSVASCSHEIPAVFSLQPENGEPPRLTAVSSIKDGAEHIAKRIHELHGEGIPYSEIAVLYASSRHEALSDTSVPDFFKETFEENGLLSTWVSQNATSKAAWDITTDSVSLCTIHSMKGLDAEAVFVWGLDGLDVEDAAQDKLNALAYIGCSRARRHLEILYIVRSPLISKLCVLASQVSSC